MADRVCIRGCKQRGVHYASCEWSGISEGVVPYLAFGSPQAPAKCTGCAERPAREHALICDGCFYRLRTLVRDVDDLLGRLRSLADPMKATPTDKAPGGRSSATEPPAPIDADLLDALADVNATVSAWWSFAFPRTLEEALDDIVNDLDDMRQMGVGWMDRNMLVDGVRSFWSVQDTVDKWGVERRTKGEPAWSDADDSEKVLGGIPEWGDQLLNRAESEKVAGTPRTLQRWLKDDRISPTATIYIAGVKTVLFRRSDLLKVKEQMQERVGRPRTRTTEHEIERRA